MNRDAPFADAVGTILLIIAVWFIYSPTGLGHAVASFEQAMSGGCKP